LTHFGGTAGQAQGSSSQQFAYGSHQQQYFQQHSSAAVFQGQQPQQHYQNTLGLPRSQSAIGLKGEYALMYGGSGAGLMNTSADHTFSYYIN